MESSVTPIDKLRSSPADRRRPIALALALLAAGALPLAAQPPAAPQGGAARASGSLADVFAKYGIRALTPPSPASDFTLPDLAGGETSLSDYYGSWVVLTFFATWCGPCRSELPTLERLHRERAGHGVVVLGVSVDDSRQPLDPFIGQLGLTFPIVWDKTKQVGAAYRASSIPISYLVDPGGRLVGVSRGSRDWAALAPMLDAALAAVPATAAADPRPDAYADAGRQVATPQVSDPPTAEVAVDTETPVAGRPFHVDVKLLWAGNFEEYLPHPPEILLPEGVVQESVTAESSSRDGRSQLRYRMTLRADEPGRYALDPVEVRYTPRFESSPVAGRVLGPTVEVVPRTVMGLPPGVLAVGSAALVLLGLVGLFVGRKLRRGKSREPSPGKELFERLQGEYEEARKKRLQGDGAGYLLALADLDEKLRTARDEPDPDEESRRSFQDALDRARYGGEVPPAEELEQLRRKVERRLDALRPDPGKNEREGLRLKDGWKDDRKTCNTR